MNSQSKLRIYTRVLRSVDGLLLAGVVTTFWARNRLRRKIFALRELDDLVSDSRVKVPIKEIEAFHRQERERSHAVEEKARSFLFSVTLAFTIILAAMTLAGRAELPPEIRRFYSCWGLVGITVGLAYLLGAGLAANAALRVEEYFELLLEDLAERPTDSDRAARLLLCIELNGKVTLIRTNFTVLCANCLRNGILALAACAWATLFLAARPQPTPTAPAGAAVAPTEQVLDAAPLLPGPAAGADAGSDQSTTVPADAASAFIPAHGTDGSAEAADEDAEAAAAAPASTD